MLWLPIILMGLPGSETAYNATVSARVGLLSDTVLPSYVNLFVAELNRSLMHNGARIVADVDNVPTLMSWRQTLTEKRTAGEVHVDQREVRNGRPAAV